MLRTFMTVIVLASMTSCTKTSEFDPAVVLKIRGETPSEYFVAAAMVKGLSDLVQSPPDQDVDAPTGLESTIVLRLSGVDYVVQNDELVRLESGRTRVWKSRGLLARLRKSATPRR